jgi:interleukin-1 receptor-associated kinase 4
LAEILEIRDSWQMLMASITQETDTGGTKLKYSSRHIGMVEREAKSNASKLTATEILFEEWGTSGRKRPTLQTLMDLLAELKLYRAADYISMNILGGVPVERKNLHMPLSLEIGKYNVFLFLLRKWSFQIIFLL